MKESKALELAHQLHHLEEMLELANNPKLLWEEMQILGKKSFILQEKMEKLLNDLEKETDEISAIQTLFETREKMWDIMKQLATAELELKQKTLTKATNNHTCCHSQKGTKRGCCGGKSEKKCTCKGKKCKKN